MDVIGTKPSTKEGECFRNSCIRWHPLADYACEIAPDITSQCRYWYSNDGYGLNAEHALALADRLDTEIREGRCDRYALRYKSAQEMAPDEPCWLCDGTGTRKPVPEVGAGDMITGIKCNSCGGEGMPTWVDSLSIQRRERATLCHVSARMRRVLYLVTAPP
jgi:hypothetical protein